MAARCNRKQAGRGRVCGVIAVAALLLAACGGGDSSSDASAGVSSNASSGAPDAASSIASTQANRAAAATTAAAVAGGFDGVYRIANRCSGKALTVADASAADRARIRIAGFTGGDHQRWRIELQADGAYRLTAQHSGKVVDASSRVLEDGVPVFHQMPWHGGANQRFAIEPLDDGSYRMLVRHNGKALDVRGASVADGATVWQWDWNGTCAQRWTLERVDVVDTTPVATAVHAGNDQQATAGTAVPVAPAIRVTDRAGRGVADAQVTFVVVAGGGSVTGAQQRTNAEGIAAVGSWTLGSTAGENILSARTAGLPEVTFRATARAPQGSGTLSAAPGSSNQSATVGTALPLAPAVVVRDATGTVRAGITVSFTPRNGGSVQQTTAVSDASGLASPGRWTLGPVAGTQTLEAAADGYGTAVLSASALAGGAPTLTRSVFMGGLQTPWDMAFTPDGVLLYTERARGLSVRLADGSTRLLYRPADFVAESQSGMLGVAIDPGFATNRAVYVYMASSAGGARDNRVLRLTVNADFTAVTGRVDIVTGITYAGGAHSGGRLRFGADGHLYITTGDTRQGPVPQRLNALGGKVLRVDRQGAAIPGNNTLAGADARIYAYGLRNPQGIAFRPGSGVPYTAEHGPNFQDEVTPLRAGGNGGWDPRCADGVGYCGYDNVTQMTDIVRFPDALRPAWTTGSAVGSSRGMGGNTFVTGSQWRDWNGAMVVALLSGRRLEVLQLTGDGLSTTRTTPVLDTFNERLRFVVQGPDGALYVGTDGKPGGDEIWRVVAN